MDALAEPIQRIAIAAVPLLLGIICHEVAHGYVAWLQGDDTAKRAGRLTLNPVPHIDPMGTLVFVMTAVLSPFVFGWAKPVPINPGAFRDPRKGMMLVSVAGPGTNIVLAVVFALLLKLIFMVNPQSGTTAFSVLQPLALICQAGIFINLILAFVNLIPVPPLDGSRIVAGLLPREAAYRYLSVERYGLLILVVLLVSGVLGRVLIPITQAGYVLLINIFGL
jgi:Zn-dependent protease